MNSSKKINVNYSSLVGLKAELLRKQTEVKDAKVNADVVPSQAKHKVKNKKSKRDKVKVPKELIDIDDVKAHKKSKLMLEAKARLYENLKKSHSNRNEHFLVDFENKSESEDEDEVVYSDDYEDANSDPEEDWVEYEDCFGRTRKCLRRDLSRMQDKDDFVKNEVMKKSQGDVEPEEPCRAQPVKIIPKEPEIEIMRRKWEEQTEKLTDKMNIHYQDVLFDEARAHGVGYYEFSQDEEVRAKQQLNLDALRKETLLKQKEMQNLKDLKEKMEQNRLKAARIRQRIRAGLPPEPIEEEIEEKESPDTDDAKTKPETEETDESDKKVVEYKEQNSLVEIENKIKAFGELLGKRTHWHEMSQEEWVDKRRKDRINEFGPAYSGFKSAGYLEGRNDDLEDYKGRTLPDTGDTSAPEITASDNTVRTFEMENTDARTIDSNSHEEDVANSEALGVTKEAIYNIDAESSNSNDSDTIGPMPLNIELPRREVSVETAFFELPEDVRTELSNIDFSKPPPNMRIDSSAGTFIPVPEPIILTPVPPPEPMCLPMGQNLPVSELLDSKNYAELLETPDGQTLPLSFDDNNITAGLRYLRANFEHHQDS